MYCISIGHLSLQILNPNWRMLGLHTSSLSGCHRARYERTWSRNRVFFLVDEVDNHLTPCCLVSVVVRVLVVEPPIRNIWVNLEFCFPKVGLNNCLEDSGCILVDWLLKAEKFIEYWCVFTSFLRRTHHHYTWVFKHKQRTCDFDLASTMAHDDSQRINVG